MNTRRRAFLDARPRSVPERVTHETAMDKLLQAVTAGEKVACFFSSKRDMEAAERRVSHACTWACVIGAGQCAIVMGSDRMSFSVAASSCRHTRTSSRSV